LQSCPAVVAARQPLCASQHACARQRSNAGTIRPENLIKPS
jgi:hypothetical protein